VPITPCALSRPLGPLEAALSCPRATVFGKDAYLDLDAMAGRRRFERGHGQG
jgi:hypothetical protein